MYYGEYSIFKYFLKNVGTEILRNLSNVKLSDAVSIDVIGPITVIDAALDNLTLAHEQGQYPYTGN